MIRYDIHLGDQTVGFACVERVGLYTQFQCQCRFKRRGSYRVVVRYGTVSIDLGLCVPDNDVFVVKTRVPTRKLNEETPCFYALDTKSHDKKFVPVNPRDNFTYIPILPKAKFCINDGIPGILIAEADHE